MVNWYDNEMNAAPKSWSLSEAADGHLVTTKEPTMRNDSIITSIADYSPRKFLSRDLKASIWRFTYGKCWYCGDSLNPYENLCIDHVYPLARGGSNDIENLVPCCSYCNIRKGTRTVEEWRINFYDIPIDEEPWCDPSGMFWFEREEKFFQQLRATEIRGYRRYQESLKTERWS